jgi:hypothetical protein
LNDEIEKLKSAFEKNGRRAGWSGQAIVVGLALDIVVLLIFAADKSWKETAAGIFATFIIGAGVWLEIHFDHKAQAAAVILQQLSDLAVAEARERAAQAEARAAEANARAAFNLYRANEIEQEFRKRSQPRFPNFLKLQTILETNTPPKNIEVMYFRECVDCETCAVSLVNMIISAGWPVNPPLARPIQTSSDRWSVIEKTGAQTWGISVIANDISDGGKGPCSVLAHALADSLGRYEVRGTIQHNSVPDGTVRVVVAPRL